MKLHGCAMWMWAQHSPRSFPQSTSTPMICMLLAIIYIQFQVLHHSSLLTVPIPAWKVLVWRSGEHVYLIYGRFWRSHWVLALWRIFMFLCFVLNKEVHTNVMGTIDFSHIATCEQVSQPTGWDMRTCEGMSYRKLSVCCSLAPYILLPRHAW